MHDHACEAKEEEAKKTEEANEAYEAKEERLGRSSLASFGLPGPPWPLGVPRSQCLYEHVAQPISPFLLLT